MGWYIDGPRHGKANFICSEHGGHQISLVEAKKLANDPGSAKVVICVVSNGPFDAAGYCFDVGEFEAFNDPADYRPKLWLAMDKKKAQELSKFNEGR